MAWQHGCQQMRQQQVAEVVAIEGTEQYQGGTGCRVHGQGGVMGGIGFFKITGSAACRLI
jgi:hypothetical protein